MKHPKAICIVRRKKLSGGKSLVFACLARDCAPYLQGFFSFLEGLQRSGIEVTVFVGENGSTDRTLEILSAASTRYSITVVDTSEMASVAGRLRRMALGRELVLGAIRSARPQAKYVCVADLDSVMAAPPSCEVVHRILADIDGSDGIFAISSSSKPHYYDLLAYDDGMVSFDDLLQRVSAARSGPFRYYRFFQKEIFAHQTIITKASPCRVVSAFNGICFYRYDEYCRSSYISQDEFAVCEHLVLNRGLATALNSSMLISDELYIKTPADHLQRNILGFYGFRLVRQARQVFARLTDRLRTANTSGAIE